MPQSAFITVLSTKEQPWIVLLEEHWQTQILFVFSWHFTIYDAAFFREISVAEKLDRYPHTWLLLVALKWSDSNRMFTVCLCGLWCDDWSQRSWSFTLKATMVKGCKSWMWSKLIWIRCTLKSSGVIYWFLVQIYIYFFVCFVFFPKSNWIRFCAALQQFMSPYFGRAVLTEPLHR